jgi:membrane-bound lytic murein transglycosylase A
VSRRVPALAAALVGCLLVGACGALRPARTPLVSVSASRLPAFSDDLDLASFREAVGRTVPVHERAGDVAAADAARRLLALLEATPDPAARRAAIARAFRVVRVRDPLLLTAYFEPELEGRLAPDDRFRHPLFGRPLDLVDIDPPVLDPTCRCRRTAGRLEDGRLRPYYSRAEIDAGALYGRGIEIAWVDDPIELFVLHVQGSGRLRLGDGSTIGIGYAGSNGRPYSVLARTLVSRGLLPADQATLPDIHRYLAGLAPEERDALLATNERYTFFRLREEGGPIGTLGVELTPERSVATDPRIVPLGTIGYVVTPTVRRFVVSQDTGGAVSGAHADLFLGFGDEAGERAGRTRDRGALYLILPRL